MTRSAQRLELTWYNKDKALIPTETGKYGYTWADPRDPRYCETHTLVLDEYVRGKQTPKDPDCTYSERADYTPTEDNLLILGESGDVLEALTRVPELAEKYLGQVKLIYIDPPFNTAQTFANYEDNLEHSVWLTMMRDRLINMKKLLRPDGSIWVHLDDVEVHRMRLLMDEIFGADRFLAEIAWEKVYSPRGDAKEISKRVDYIIGFAKTSSFAINSLKRPADLSQFKHVDSSGRHYRSDPLRKWGKNSLRSDRPSLWYPILSPEGTQVWPIKSDGTQGRWRWQEETYLRRQEEIDWIDKGNGLQPYVRQYADESDTRPPENLWLSKDCGHNQEAKEEVKSLFPREIPFATPKPERLLERIIHLASAPGDIVLDVFAGSGTTAAVAQKMGRRWVTCELVKDTFERFTKPRLSKVVNDEDPGGVTVSPAGREAADGVALPEGMTAEDAQKLTSLLNKAIKDKSELKKSADIKQLKAEIKTVKTPETINWRGGGGFQVAHLNDACFDFSPELGQVVLTEAATGQNLIESVAAHLGFKLELDDLYFDGKRGNSLLKVHEGALSKELMDNWLSHLEPAENLTIAAASVPDGIRKYSRELRKGTKIVQIPDGIFQFYGPQGDQ